MVEGAGGTATKAGGSSAPDPLLGRVIAERFKIKSLIARGGMGKVYKAEQSPLGRLCAIKVLNPNYNGDADPEFHRRFFREASITSRITHPNSVTIFDYGKTDDDVYYMAMEYLDGQTLHQALREAGFMDEYRVGRIAQQICRALREAHALDVIHRDLKPANIFLMRHGTSPRDEDDFVKVLDFGLVKHLSERPEEQLTQTGLFMGSPKYMAPEQIQGGHVDARTDVYSLGIMMYEMLAGKVPFERPTSVNILMAHVGEPPPPMREVKPDINISPMFEDLVMRCIAKDPAVRFTTMDEVLQGIKRAHGVAMTGQLAALHSGAYIPVATDPPPAVRSSVPAFAAGTSGQRAHLGPGASGSHSGQQSPIALLGSTGSGDALYSDSGAGVYSEREPRRSKAWIALGVLVAAALGGLLGMAAFRMTAPAGTTATTAGGASAAATTPGPTTSTSAASATTASAASTGSAPSPGAERVVTMKVTTDPPGASVREDTTELCPATPCDVTFKGDAADPAKVHKLSIIHMGFRPELKTVKAGDPPVHVRLTRSTGGGMSRPVSPPTTKPTSTEASPNGFKDLPY